jgi:hypothetical protein
MGGAYGMFGERRGDIMFLLVKHGGKALLWRRKLRQDTVQRILSKWDAIAWGGLIWLRIERGGRLRVPYNARNFLTTRGTILFAA